MRVTMLVSHRTNPLCNNSVRGQTLWSEVFRDLVIFHLKAIFCIAADINWLQQKILKREREMAQIWENKIKNFKINEQIKQICEVKKIRDFFFPPGSYREPYSAYSASVSSVSSSLCYRNV